MLLQTGPTVLRTQASLFVNSDGSSARTAQGAERIPNIATCSDDRPIGISWLYILVDPTGNRRHQPHTRFFLHRCR